MAPLRFDVTGLEFSTLPHFGADHPMARLAGAAGAAGDAPLPLLSDAADDHVSVSPFARASLPATSGDARCVVAGQQPGLLTGPLYTFLKAVTAIAAAARLQERLDAPVVPVFWNASEDHDVLEVNRVTVNGDRFVCDYQGEIAHGKVPQVADIPLADAKEDVVGFLRQALPETEFTPWVIDTVASADFSTYATAFNDIMRSLFARWELRIVEPRDLRERTAPVLASLVERWSEVQAAFERGSRELKDAGYDPPLESAGLFEIVDGCRSAVEISGSDPALADEIRRRPLDFSPGAALRPILQDAVLPVVGTVGGPSEIVYLCQIRPIYGTVDVTPSLVVPRISATFVEDKIRRAAEKLGLEPGRIFEAPVRLAAYAPDDGSWPEVDDVEQAGRHLVDALDRAAGAGPSRQIARARKSISSHVEKAVRRLREERLEAAGVGRKRLERIADALVPGGKPQERVLNIMQFLNLYGPDFVGCAVETLDPFSSRHQAVFLHVNREE